MRFSDLKLLIAGSRRDPEPWEQETDHRMALL
jgi:hypothetical protein